MLKLKRAYDDPSSADGTRVLVDRFWPRGVKKEDAQIDWWAKELAPSDDLRRWFDHDPERYGEFARRYEEELGGAEALGRLRALLEDEETVTLVYAARDEEHNNARALHDLLVG